MTPAEARELLDDIAVDDLLTAIREFPHFLTAYRLGACATAEPAVALLHAYDLLMPERRAACVEAARLAGLERFVPDRLALERSKAIALARGKGVP